MAYTIADIKNDLEGILKGQSTSKITNILTLINRSARQVLLDCDPQETKVVGDLELFDEVFDYAPPTDLKGNKVIDIRPQVNRKVRENFTQTYSEQFDLRKFRDDVMFTFEFNSGVKKLRVKKNLTQGTTIDTISGISDNGTWAVGNDATNLTEDNRVFKSDNASLNFDLDGSTTDGFIQNSTLTAVDLSDHEDQSSLFAWGYFPDASAITSADLQWGSSTTAFWNRTVTVPVFGSGFVNGWNQLKFAWNGATKTLSPDSSAINFLRATINYDGVAETDIRVDNVVSTLPELNELHYYSKFIFSNSAGVFQETATDDTDTVNLDTETFNLLLWKISEYAVQQVPDFGDVKYFAGMYAQTLRRYKAIYKSEIEKPKQQYYRPFKPVNRRIKRTLRT